MFHNLVLLIFVAVIAVPENDLKTLVLILEVLRVDFAQQIRNFLQLLIPVKQTSGNQGNQEYDNGNNSHGRTGHNGNGGCPAVVFLPAFRFCLSAAGRFLPGLVLGLLVAFPLTIRTPTGTGSAGTCRCPGHPFSRILRFSGSLFFRHQRSAADHRRVVHTPCPVIKENCGFLPELIHIIQHRRSGNISAGHIHRHGLHDNLLHACRDIGIQGRWQRRTAVDVLNGHSHRRFSVVRRPSGHHLVHHNAQRVQIRPIVHPAALGLLRGDVMNGTQRFLGQGIALGHHPGDAKVCNLHAAVFQHHHVVGLDIPMDNAPAVGMLQSLGNLHGKMQGFLPVQDAFLLHVLLQADAVNQFHDNVVRTVNGRNIVNRHNVGVTQHGNCLTLRLEATPEFLVLRVFVF